MLKMENEIESELKAATARLYAARTPEKERSELSMRVAILRGKYARAIRVTPWTATAALAASEVDDEAG